MTEITHIIFALFDNGLYYDAAHCAVCMKIGIVNEHSSQYSDEMIRSYKITFGKQ